MNAQIKATCPFCGDVELTADQVVLHECSLPGRSYYAFECPGCADEIKKPADQRVVTLLRTGGVRVEYWAIPAEVLEHTAGPRLTMDDLLDFTLALSRTDDLVLEARSVGAR